jgi:hypothetical protein
MNPMVKLILKAVSVGTSVGAVVCMGLNIIEEKGALTLIGIGLVALSVNSLIGEQRGQE